jgi:carbonic anhydrase
MRLFEAIVDANHRALAGDNKAGLHPADFADALPIVALTCIDPRLNPLFPEVLGVSKEQFIWLRNAGNIITSSTSSTMRSLALACAVKGGKEIVIIGHNDCQVCKTSTMKLTDAFRALGVERSSLPENLTEFFGMFASERQNVIKATDLVRRSPLIGPRIPVHGLMVDVETGKLEWVVNGYQILELASASPSQQTIHSASQTLDTLKSLEDFKIGEMKFPETKIGEVVTKATNWLSQELQQLEAKPMEPVKTEQTPPVQPGKIPVPPPIRLSYNVRKWNK